jgi:SprT protein
MNDIKFQYPQLIERIESKVLDTYLRAEKVFGKPLELPKLDFTVRGKCVGAWALASKNLINFNPHFFQFESNRDEIVNQIVPHEIAHLLADKFFPSLKRAHGPEWKYVAIKLGIPPIRCHEMEGSKETSRHPRPYVYGCTGCKKRFNFTQRMHNKVQQTGRNRICLACRCVVMYLHQIAVPA